VSTLFDREHPPRRDIGHAGDGADDDTAEIPATVDRHDPDLTYDPADADRARLRPSLRARRRQMVLLLGAYVPACLGSAWLTILAFLRLNPIVMVLMIAATIWLGLDTVSLIRWLGRDTVSRVRWLVQFGRPHASVQQPQLSRLQPVVACVLAVTYAWLLVDWLLHQ
jgi:hypothetical protein